ncbi:MAG: hypothetical protein E7B53_04800 [Clostridium sp.]|uniref:hypothetical protein n=1 Tax=Clostridium sp. TaxID=1506 RepID=UPI002902956B|nr:hypothetical protein [Clostridium sp.]MDU2894447.1 hypothetical protein [Clostridium sp.]MDU3006255.1 hypothetical protein [Clostridium sp.]MDU3036208.1 hypothetical protein [Clostridium sp.]MDU3050165.1 hypothetical protein [Clostridium sp.]
MRYRMLDIDGDYQFGKGQQNFTYGTYAVAQAIKTRLKLLKGEWWENTSEGLPLFEQIIGVNGSQDDLYLVDSIIKERIIGTENVKSIESFKSEYINRAYTFSCVVNSKFGEVTVTM